MSPPKLPFTLVIITRNEASHIAQCLDSVPIAAEKVVVDSGSTDGTQQIAAAHGARVVHQDWLGFGPQRNFATTQASHDWILSLDADETLSPDLLDELIQRLPALFDSNAAGAILRREAWYMGAPMRWYRPMMGERLGRLYHRKRARWTDSRVHESLLFDAPAPTFESPFLHHQNPTLVHKQFKTMLYAELKARDWLDRQRPVRMWLAPLVFMASFFKDYFLRLAFLDGWRGYIVAQTAAAYAVYKRMRYYEMRRNPASVGLAARQLGKYGLENPSSSASDGKIAPASSPAPRSGEH